MRGSGRSGEPVAKARVRIQLKDEAEALRVRDALAPDNGGHIECEVDGASLTLRAEAGSAMGLLRSIDDALGCVRATGVP